MPETGEEKTQHQGGAKWGFHPGLDAGQISRGQGGNGQGKPNGQGHQGHRGQALDPEMMRTAFGGAKGRTDVPKIVDWYMDGKINIDDLITHTMPLEEINTAFDLMHEGKSIRSVVTF